MDPFQNVDYVPPTQSDNVSMFSSQINGNFQAIQVGAGKQAYKADRQGIWLGALTFAEAPFSVDMAGNVVANSIMISGVSGALIAAGIDASGNFVNQLISSNLNTATKQILGEFTFAGSGALAIKTDSSNGLWLSPTGILGKKAGSTTFAIDVAGNATFGGTLVGASGTFGTITAGTLVGVTLKTANNMWVGAISGHSGISLNGTTDYNNIFFKRDSDGVVFFRVNSGGASSMTYDSASGNLAITGGTITGSAFKANGGAGIDTWISNDGYLRFMYGASEKAKIWADSSGFLQFQADNNIYMRNSSGNDIFITAGKFLGLYGKGAVQMGYNNDGGSDTMVWLNSSTTVMVMNDSNDFWVKENCSAQSFTDRTPHYEGQAVLEIKQIRGKNGKNGEREIDHDSLPPFMRKTIKNEKGEIVEERNLGNAISMLLKATQELDNRLEKIERKA